MRSDATKTRLFVIIVPLAILVLALLGGYELVWRLFFISVLLLLLGYLWARLGLRGIEGKVEYFNWDCQVGDFIRGVALIRNTSTWPTLMLRLSQDTNLPGYTNRLAINIPPRGSHYWQIEVRCCLRGRYRLGQLTAEVTDPFGFIQVRRNLGDSRNLLVYPKTVELSFSPVMPSSDYGSEQNCWLRTAPPSGVSQVREYIPGDSLNHIHWRSTAHAGRLMVKDFSLDVAKNTWIVVDMAKVSPQRSNTGSVIEERITLAASLTKKYLDGGQPLGVMTEGDTFHCIPPATGEEHFRCVMETLALVKAEGKTPVDRLIDREKERFGADSLVLAITSSITDRLSAWFVQLNNQGIKTALILPENAGSSSLVNSYVICRHLDSKGIPVYIARGVNTETAALDALPLLEALITV